MTEYKNIFYNGCSLREDIIIPSVNQSRLTIWSDYYLRYNYASQSKHLRRDTALPWTIEDKAKEFFKLQNEVAQLKLKVEELEYKNKDLEKSLETAEATAAAANEKGQMKEIHKNLLFQLIDNNDNQKSSLWS